MTVILNKSRSRHSRPRSCIRSTLLCFAPNYVYQTTLLGVKSLIEKPDSIRVERRALYAPRFWGTWVGLGVMWLWIQLPFSAQTALGRGLGRLASRVARREIRIGQINLQLCFPEWSQQQRAEVLQRHFEFLGCALFDTALAWWASDKRVLRLTSVQGMENLERALQGGRGALLVCAHFTAAEMGVRAMAVRRPVAGMYQTPRNAVLADRFRNSAGVQSAHMISSDNVRAVLRALKDNLPVWFAADQREDMRSCTLAPFFGIPVASNTAPSRLAKISGAPVLPFFIERTTPDDKGPAGYCVRIGAPLEDFPSENEIADATRLHAQTETDVRRCPPQYLWTYKRFKHPDADPYRK